MVGILDGAGAISNLVGGVLDRAWPNPNELEKHKLEALKIAMASELAIHETNKAEAQHPSMFVAGWRPFVGWVCASGLVYNFIAYPLLSWASLAFGIMEPPALELGPLIGLLSGMLGFGALRTYEGMNGTKRTKWKNPDAS